MQDDNDNILDVTHNAFGTGSPIQVSIIAKRGASILAQWKDDEGRVKRAFVPIQYVKDDLCPADVLSESVPYGDDWEELVISASRSLDISPEEIATALRNAGYWTTQDVERDVSGAQSVVNRAIGVSVVKMCKLARQAAQEQKEA